MSGPCSCWTQVSLHSDHCCFAGSVDSFTEAALPPCGHWPNALELEVIS